MNIISAELTAIMIGANTNQQMYQNLLSLMPIIWCIQLQNFCVPNIQDIDIVWKKQTHNIEIPLTE